MMAEQQQQTADGRKSNGAIPTSTNTATTIIQPQRKSNGTRVEKEKDSRSPQKDDDRDENKTNGSAHDTARKPKRRKVNHACVYCRRSHMTCDLERPCARCVKRDIGHLCHDEPREPNKRTKSEQELAPAEKHQSPGHDVIPGTEAINAFEQDNGALMSNGDAGNTNGSHIIQPQPISPIQVQKRPSTSQQYNTDQWDFGQPDQLSDMRSLHPYNTFNTSEVTNEYNLLGDFLNTSLFDEGLYNGDDAQALFSDPLLNTASLNTFANTSSAASLTGQPSAPMLAGDDITRPSSTYPVDPKARDKFYLTAADPAGNDTAEERMNKLLKAKYDAGMLKPFNYVKGYARLNNYMEKNMRPASRQKILRQLDKFRPKFREAMKNLTDIQLVKVEMWFERSLMEYDRVFASMAIPACCWRRTGEIFRGNKEMAELIHVPIEQLRDASAHCFMPCSKD